MGYLTYQIEIDFNLMPGLQTVIIDHQDYRYFKNYPDDTERYATDCCHRTINDLSYRTETWTYYYRALAKIYLKQYQEAKKDLDKVLELQKDNHLIYNKRGCVIYCLGNIQEALMDLDISIKINSNFAESYCNKGYIQFHIGEKEKALDNFDRAVKLNPKYTQAYFFLGITKFDLNDFEGAIQAYKKCIALNSIHDDCGGENKFSKCWRFAKMGLGRAYYKNGEFNNALDCFRQVVEINIDWWLPVNHGIKAFKAINNPVNPPDLNTDTSKRIALVIGNSSYQSNPLGNVPHNDTETMVNVLKQVDFDEENIMMLKDATKTKFNEVFEAFLNKAKTMQADVALVHFSGHGVEIHKVQYWLPIEMESMKTQSKNNWIFNLARALIKRPDEEEFISVDEVLQKMAEAGIPFKVIFSDACRNNNFYDDDNELNPQYGGTRGKSTGVAYVSAKTEAKTIDTDAGSFLCLSTNAGNFADNQEKYTQNSPFVNSLRNHLKKGADIQLLMQAVAGDVNRQSPDLKQKPQIICTPLQGFEF